LNLTVRTRAQLVYVVDIDEARARQVAEEVGCRFATELTEQVMQNVDAIIIASTTDTHFKLIKAGLSAGKAVFTEKPISHDPSEVAEVIAMATAGACPFIVGYQRRCDKHYRALKANLHSIGEVRLVKCTSRDNPMPPMSYLRTSGGIFHDMLSHDFDMIHYLTGEWPIAVYALGHAFDESIREMDDVDTVLVVLKYASGMIASVDSCRISEPGYDQRVEVFGSKGVARVGNVHETSIEIGTSKGFYTPKTMLSFPQRYKDTYLAELHEFISMCHAGVVEDATTIQRHQALEVVATCAELSCRLSREVLISEVAELRKKPKVVYSTQQ